MKKPKSKSKQGQCERVARTSRRSVSALCRRQSLGLAKFQASVIRRNVLKRDTTIGIRFLLKCVGELIRTRNATRKKLVGL